MNKEILNKIEALEAELQKLKNEVKQGVKFKVGKWYKDINSLMMFYITEIKGGFKGYGLNTNGEWRNNEYDDCLFYGGNLHQAERELIPATHQEVEEALIKEAKKRGFKKGVSFKTVERKGISGSYNTKFKFDRMNVCIYKNETVLLNNCDGCIFCNGVWAEIVKDELIKIGGYEVRKKGDYYFIGCKTIGKELIENLQILMQSQNFKKVSFDGVEIDIEIINKILAL